MQCHQCGTINPDENNFCGQCGVRLLRERGASLSESAKANRVQGTGSALSILGVTDIATAAPREPVVRAADPIKPASYLLDQDIPEVPRSVAEPSVGEPSVTQAEIKQATPNKVEENARQETTISGPSFLGLTGSSTSDSDYLIQDEPAPRRGGWIVFTLVAIIIFVVIGWLEWNTIKTGHIKLPFGHSSASAPATPASPGANPSATDSNAAATNADATSGQDKLTTNEPGSVPPADTGTNSSTATKSPEPDNAKTDSAKPADDSANSEASAIEASQTRQAQDAKQRRAGVAQDTSEAQPENAKTPATPELRDKKPDPRQDKMLLLGEKYLYGRGVPANCSQAMVYFRAAAENNNAPAMAHLGALYQTGQCVQQDRAQAYSWLKRAHATDPSNQWIEHDMNVLWRDMSTQERAAVAH